MTITELIITLSIAIVLCGASFFASMDAFRGAHVRAGRDALIAELMHARTQAMLGVCAEGDVVCARATSTRVRVGPSEVVFAPYSGAASISGPSPLRVTDALGHESLITVSPLGRITWTH